MNRKTAVAYSHLKRTVRNPGLWLVLVLLSLITLFNYMNGFDHPSMLSDLMNDLGLTRHAFARILYLIPIVLGGYLFGWIGATTTSLVAVTAMVHYAISISPSPVDALFETGGVFFIGNGMALTAHSLRKERQYQKMLEKAQDKLHFYIGMVNKAQEEERKRISHELHDDTIQGLVVLSRELDVLASTDNGLAKEYRDKLEELRQHTNNIMVGLRRLSQDLRPAALDRLGLLSAIEWLAEEVSRFSGIRINISLNGELGRLSEEKELGLFRIAQETLRNVWRHSQASEVEIKVDSDTDKIRITIRDNGKGFQMPENMSDLPANGKLGLAGIQERAQLLGANLHMESKLGEGTSMSIEVET